jgi:prevent-host-death family protein
VTDVNIHEAKTHLSRLLAEVEAGGEVTICRAGKPIARVVPIPKAKGKRPLGIDKGRAFLNPDFFDPLPPDILDALEGRTD